MNNAEIERLLIGAGVIDLKFGGLTNVWVKNRESLLCDGIASKILDDKYIDHIANDNETAIGKDDAMVRETLADLEVVKGDVKEEREKLLFDEDANKILDKYNVKGEDAVTEKGDALVKAEAMKGEIFEDDEEEDEQSSQEKLYSKTCPHCGEVKHRKSINRHIRMVHLTTKLQCNQCGLKLNSRDKLKIHISKVHGIADDMKQCSFCEKVFDGKGKTNFHETMMHREEVANDFKCENCEKCYKTRANMQRHTRTCSRPIMY